MAKGTNVSSPLPWIGLYIAGATLVCFILIVRDILHAYHRRNSWISCRYLKISSLTLTLIAVATKLPLDLTTEMPGIFDQLSKVYGSELMCIFIVLMTPTIGTRDYNENFTDWVSIIIIVLVIIVDLIIQMATGVIFEFIVEHIISIILMLLLVVILWFGISMDSWKIYTRAVDRLLEDEYEKNNLIRVLEICYSSYVSNCEFSFYSSTCYATIGMLSFVSLFTTLVATIKALIDEKPNFEHASAYKWSISAVIMIQIATIVVGSLGIGFRCLHLLRHMNFYSAIKSRNIPYLNDVGLILSRWKLHSLCLTFPRFKVIIGILQVVQKYMYTCMRVTYKCLNMLDLAIFKAGFVAMFCWNWIKNHAGCLNDETVRHDIHVTSAIAGPYSWLLNEDWLKRRSDKSMKMLIKRHKNFFLHNFVNLLSQEVPSDQFETKQWNCLALVLFLRMIGALATSSSNTHLIYASLDETFEILCFVEEIGESRRRSNEEKRAIAKDIWMSRNTNDHWFQKLFIRPLRDALHSGIDVGLEKEGKLAMFREECEEIEQIINGCERGEMVNEAVCSRITQLVIDTFHSFLNELPSAIFKYISESSHEERRKRTKRSIKYLSKLKLMDTQVLPWTDNANVINYIPTTVADDAVNNDQ